MLIVNHQVDLAGLEKRQHAGGIVVDEVPPVAGLDRAHRHKLNPLRRAGQGRFTLDGDGRGHGDHAPR